MESSSSMKQKWTRRLVERERDYQVGNITLPTKTPFWRTPKFKPSLYMFIRRFRVQGLGLTISVECPNPRTGKHGKINIILNPKLAEKEFGFMNLFTRKSEGGAKNSGMSSLRSAGLFRTLSQESATLAKRRSGASNLPFCQQPPKLNKIRFPS
jgi:hypothetical protein